jgi:protein-S-isoprenylcysteine O-methyltransferase Ste14
MPTEDPFRIALVAVIVLTMAVTAYHRLQAASSGEKISHREEGYLFATVLRLAGLVLWISTFGYLIFPASFQWAALPLPTWLRWFGVVTGAFCSLLMYWTLSSLGKNLTDTVVTREKATLVTCGPYRWVRHPFYVTAALLMASVTLLTSNWLIGLSSAVVLVLLAIRTPKEEQMLVERFGSAIPGLHRQDRQVHSPSPQLVTCPILRELGASRDRRRLKGPGHRAHSERREPWACSL